MKFTDGECRLWPRAGTAVPACLLLLIIVAAGHAQDTVRITLPEAITLASARNIDLLRAQNSVRSAQSRIVSARGAFQPNLTFSAGPSFRYQLGTSSNPQFQQERASESFSLGLSSSYALYNGNADRAAVNQAEYLARASDITVNRSLQNTVFAVMTAYYQIAIARQLVEVARQDLDAERHQLERVRAFTDAGTRAISDRYTEEATVAGAELRLLNAQRDMDLATLDLVQLLRLNPLGHYDFPAPEPVTPSEVFRLGDTALAAHAFAQRPEIAAQQARLEAAREAIHIAEAGSAPTLSLSGSLGSSFSSNDQTETFGGQLLSQNPSVGLGLSLSVPIFDRNRTSAAEEQAQIDYQNELLTMAELRQQTSIDVRQAQLDLATALAQVDVTGRQLLAAQQAQDVEQARYETGVSTLTELTLARARYVDAEGQVIQARNTLEMRRQSLLLAIGDIAATRAAPQPPTEEELRRP